MTGMPSWFRVTVVIAAITACSRDGSEHQSSITTDVALVDSVRGTGDISRDTIDRREPQPSRPSDAALAFPVDSSADASSEGWEEVGDGLWWFDSTLADVRMSVVRVDSRRRRVWLMATTNPIDSSKSLEGYASESGAVAGVTGGFLRSYFPPLPTGLVQVNGRLLAAASQRSSFTNALVRFDSVTRRTAIERMPDANKLSRSGSALQTGPLMIIDGAPQAMSASLTARAERAFIARDASGRVLIGVSGRTTLPRLVDLLIRAEGPFGAVEAANLSGSSNAGLLLRRGGETVVRGDAYTTWHNVILVK